MQTLTCRISTPGRKKLESFFNVQCDFEDLDTLKPPYAVFPSLSENNLVDRRDNGQLMNEYAEEKGLTPQLHKKLFSSSNVQNGVFNSPLLLFYLEVKLACTKKIDSLRRLRKRESPQLCTISCRCR